MKRQYFQFGLRTALVAFVLIAISSPWWNAWYEEFAARNMFTPIKIAAWTRVSPFTQIEFVDDGIDVVYEGKTYQLKSVDGIPSARLYRIAELQWGRSKVERRFVEDFADTLLATGKDPSSFSVDIVLRDKNDGRTFMVSNASMNAANRSELMRWYRRVGSREPYSNR